MDTLKINFVENWRPVMFDILIFQQHTSGAETIQDIGGLDFLTSLRKDMTSALQPLVDQILENCMRLPDIDVGLDHAPACIYQRQNNTGKCSWVQAECWFWMFLV